ncbi:MAG: hypothetical protein HOG34_15035 [Bacteroidetes bacterium]|jgi:hypothetical protein|nr:hypothetical protein [Bacteroidota bacterium]
MVGNMHPYQIEEKIKTRIIITAFVLSIALARIFSLGAENLPIKIPWWIETPSVLGFFGLIIFSYNRWFWKTKFFQSLEWFYIPNLNGIWKAEILSSHNDFASPIICNMNIRQTASHISLSLETSQSISSSENAILTRVDKFNQFELIYNYVNKPKADAISSMNIHHGTTWLQILDNSSKLDGEYYSGRGRQNFGRIVLKRSKRT